MFMLKNKLMAKFREIGTNVEATSYDQYLSQSASISMLCHLAWTNNFDSSKGTRKPKLATDSYNNGLGTDHAITIRVKLFDLA